MGGGNTDEGTTTSGTHHHLSQLKRKAKTKVKEFIHTAQMKREHVERLSRFLLGANGKTGSTR